MQTALDLKANLASPAFTGTVTGITKAMVGLGNVDNTSDLLKPVSSSTQTALNLKANLNNPTFTGVVTSPTIAGDAARLGTIPTPSSFLSKLEVNGEDALNIYGNGGVGNKTSIYLSAWLDNTYRPVPSAAIQALDNSYSSDLLLSTAPSGDGNSTVQERMRITANGLVGIGNQNPTNMLDVDGTVRATTINATTALQINGTSTATLYASKPWVQCVVNTNGTIITNSSVGRVTPTIARTSGQSVGAWDITFTSHPNGVAYTHSIQVRTDTGVAFGVISNILAGSCKVRLYNASQALTDYQFSLIIFA